MSAVDWGMRNKFAAKKPPVPKSRAAAASKKVVLNLSRDFVLAKKVAAKESHFGQTSRGGVRVSVGIAPGGFTVYGSPIKPRRISHEQIVAAVAALD